MSWVWLAKTAGPPPHIRWSRKPTTRCHRSRRDEQAVTPGMTSSCMRNPRQVCLQPFHQEVRSGMVAVGLPRGAEEETLPAATP
ncbi:hypothetical protein CT0861_06841 [Colletotrichum tofieldiae]|uniref:Uncharacterized protein n=1 Tax=Colletotrichum tofieldiae TaxID=708197 RepID=A0A161W969_9PEZI|nr:hypothetical protein CT0861_06841 [Colletotrichum tofieldiae]